MSDNGYDLETKIADYETAMRKAEAKKYDIKTVFYNKAGKLKNEKILFSIQVTQTIDWFTFPHSLFILIVSLNELQTETGKSTENGEQLEW